MERLAILCLAIGFVLCTSASPAGADERLRRRASEPTCTPQQAPDLLVNGGFEQGTYAPSGLPEGWSRGSWLPSVTFWWENAVAHSGAYSVGIWNPIPNDAYWKQSVSVGPGVPHRLSGWIRTEGVAAPCGANLSLYGTWSRSSGVCGTNDWTYRALAFNPGDEAVWTVAARLGFWAGETSGTAWFDDLALREILPRQPNPPWRILVLVYPETDVVIEGDDGTPHRMLAAMTSAEQEAAVAQALTFVETDLPRLSGGNLTAIATVRVAPTPLESVSPCGEGWWPAQADTAEGLDPLFDSVLVFYDPRATDQVTGEPVWLGCGAGLTPPTGTGQTYSAIIIESVFYGHRNVLKHEFGHSLLFYFDALGVAPEPMVEIHATPDMYVHCPTGTDYVWIDETDEEPIPNSIYNNDAGFVHDVYSGTTATPDQPERCLGVTPDAWAYGGPLTVLGIHEARSPRERIDSLAERLDGLVTQGIVSWKTAKSLDAALRSARSALERGRIKAVTTALSSFLAKLEQKTQSGLIPAAEGYTLAYDTRSILGQLCP